MFLTYTILLDYELGWWCKISMDENYVEKMGGGGVIIEKEFG